MIPIFVNSAGLDIQSGYLYSTDFYPSNMTKIGPDANIDYNITFSPPFTVAPQIICALSQVEIVDGSDTRVACHIFDVTPTGF